MVNLQKNKVEGNSSENKKKHFGHINILNTFIQLHRTRQRRDNIESRREKRKRYRGLEGERKRECVI